jgi:hypothetical protein
MSRSFGIGIAGGYGWEAIQVTSGPVSVSGSATGVVYPSAELQFFLDNNASFDVSLPIGALVHAAANGTTAIGATVYYSPSYNTGSVRGVLAPGFGLREESGSIRTRRSGAASQAPTCSRARWPTTKRP